MFKKMKEKLAKKNPPRPLPAIQQEYQQLCATLGQFHYTVYATQLDIDRTNKRLIEVNQEAAERKKLDAEAAAQKAAQPQQVNPEEKK